MTTLIYHESQIKTTSDADQIYLYEIVSQIFTNVLRLRMVVFIFFIFLTCNIIAQQKVNVSVSDSSSSTPIFHNSINMCPIAIAFGIYSVNFEHLFGQTHGLVARFDFESISDTYSGDPIEATGVGFTLNYRYHLSHAMESWFVGSFARYRIYNGDGTSGSTDFVFDITELTLGLNAGKRWVWDSGFNITFALGYGISFTDRENNPSSTEIESTITAFEDEYTFLGPFLGELSIGYAF